MPSEKGRHAPISASPERSGSLFQSVALLPAEDRASFTRCLANVFGLPHHHEKHSVRLGLALGVGMCSGTACSPCCTLRSASVTHACLCSAPTACAQRSYALRSGLRFSAAPAPSARRHWTLSASSRTSLRLWRWPPAATWNCSQTRHAAEAESEPARSFAVDGVCIDQINLQGFCACFSRFSQHPPSPQQCAASSAGLGRAQVREFEPSLVAIRDGSRVAQLRELLKDAAVQPEIVCGDAGACEVAAHRDADSVVTGAWPCIWPCIMRNAKLILRASK